MANVKLTTEGISNYT